MNNVYLVGDTHGYPIEIKNKDALLIHLGDAEDTEIIGECRTKILIRGNHDEETIGKCFNETFDLIVDSLVMYDVFFTHEPAERLPKGCCLNIHGHLHDLSYSDYGYEQKPFHIRLIPHELSVLGDIKKSITKELSFNRVR